MAIKKKSFSVEIPLLNLSTEIKADSLEHLDRKTLKIDLTRMLRGKCLEAVFEISAKDSKATANPKKFTLLPFFIRRLMRKNISYVEDSFSCECKDGKVRVKPFLITRKRVSRRLRKELRDKTKEFIQAFASSCSTAEIFSAVLSSALQKELAMKLKKIYPLSLCEVRYIAREK